jgi:hypothetical protein
MSLVSLVEEFNQAGASRIDLKPTRGGSVGAVLPRVGREVLIEDSDFKADVRVTPRDLAAVCQEVRLALAPGLALLDAALEALARVNEDETQS